MSWTGTSTSFDLPHNFFPHNHHMFSFRLASLRKCEARRITAWLHGPIWQRSVWCRRPNMTGSSHLWQTSFHVTNATGWVWSSIAIGHLTTEGQVFGVVLTYLSSMSLWYFVVIRSSQWSTIFEQTFPSHLKEIREEGEAGKGWRDERGGPGRPGHDRQWGLGRGVGYPGHEIQTGEHRQCYNMFLFHLLDTPIC